MMKMMPTAPPRNLSICRLLRFSKGNGPGAGRFPRRRLSRHSGMTRTAPRAALVVIAA